MLNKIKSFLCGVVDTIIESRRLAVEARIKGGHRYWE
jgi:hypothetical protein